jgi:hypothetical protein
LKTVRRQLVIFDTALDRVVSVLIALVCFHISALYNVSISINVVIVKVRTICIERRVNVRVLLSEFLLPIWDIIEKIASVTLVTEIIIEGILKTSFIFVFSFNTNLLLEVEIKEIFTLNAFVLFVVLDTMIDVNMLLAVVWRMQPIAFITL